LRRYIKDMFAGADMGRLKKHQFNFLRFAMSDSETRKVGRCRLTL
jgi:hypothetical protein